MAYPDESDAVRLAYRRETARVEAEKKAALKKRRGREWMFLLPVLVLALLAWPNFGVAKVVGHSMEPTYHPDDSLLILRTYQTFSPLKPGDVVIIKLRHGALSGEKIVKRVMFVQNAGGDAKWPQFLPSPTPGLLSSRAFPKQVLGYDKVPTGSIMVMGDNMDNSTDSRDFGPVFIGEIIGKVIKP